MMSDEPYTTCVHCDKAFSGPEPYLEHLKSKAHEKKMVEKTNTMMLTNSTSNENKLRCDVCNVSLSGAEPMKQHLNGNKHLSMLKKNAIMKTIEPQPQVFTPSENVLSCKVCAKCFSGPENLKQHLISKKHIRKVDMLSMKEQLDGVDPSCPPPPGPMDNLPKTNIYPSLTEDYKIVRATISNENPIPAKKTTGCFPSLKMIFKSKKGKQNKASKNEKQLA